MRIAARTAGAWADAQAGIALGFRRLSIIDLSPAGHQPMASSGGRFVIAFNGEIYNHLELRAEYRAAKAGDQVRVDQETYTHFLEVLDQPPSGLGFERLMRASKLWQA